MREKILSLASTLLAAAIAIIAFVGVMFFLRAFGAPLWSQEAAGWVQAVGSIAAIGIAIQLAERQHRSAQELMKSADATALIQRLGSVLAILDHAASQVENVCDRIKGEGIYSVYRDSASSQAITNIDRMLCIFALDSFAGKPQFADVVEMINRIPMHELGSFELIGAVFRAKEVLERFDDHLRMAHAQGEDKFQDGPIWNGATVANLVLDGSRSKFRVAINQLTEKE